jgi:hypothetical protein
LVKIHVSRASNGTSGDFYCTLTLPQNAPPEGGWPVILVNSTSASTSDVQTSLQFNSSDSVYTNRGYAKIVIHFGTVSNGDISGDNGAAVIANGYPSTVTSFGLVDTLYPDYRYYSGTQNSGGAKTQDNFYTDSTGKTEGTQFYNTDDGWVSDYGDPDAPGLMIRWAWGVSRLIDALEAEKAKPKTDRLINLLDPAKIAVTGASRMGKSSLITGAFEPRIAVVAPSETCAGGLNIDRFVSISVNEEDSHINQQWLPYNIGKTSGFSPFDGFGPINKYYQYLKLGDTRYGTLGAKKVTAAEALIDPTKDLDGGVTKPFPTGSGVTAHILWNDASQPNADTGATNLKPGYGVHQHVLGYPTGTSMNAWGPQPLTDIRWRYSTYWNGRFFQMPLIFNKMNLHNRPQIMGDFGYFANAPFDMHYLSALVAPRPLFMVGGFNSENSGAEAMFMNFLATREVYRFLGKEDNIGIAVYVHGHTQVEREVQDLMDVCDSIYAGGDMPRRLTPRSVDEYPFPINDPRSRFDYVKLDWAAPGYESIADQVKRLVPAK